MPTLTQLTYLTAVDRFRHFGRAAEDAGVTQPTLSMQLKKLEEELGVELFDRTQHPVEPTDAGRLVVAQARRVLREAEQLVHVLDESSSQVAGELRIGVLPTLAPYLLPGLVPDLTSRYPALTLYVKELQTQQVLAGLESEDLDVGVIATPVDAPRLTERVLFVEPFVGYLSDRHRLFDRDAIRSGDLVVDELWLLQEGHCFRDHVISVCQGGSGACPVGAMHFETSSLETLRRLVDRSGGMTLLPALATVGMSEEEMRRVRRFEQPGPKRTVRLVYGKAYLKRASIDALAQELVRLVPDEFTREA